MSGAKLIPSRDFHQDKNTGPRYGHEDGSEVLVE